MMSGKSLREQIPTNTITPNRTNFPKDTRGLIRGRYEKQNSETGLQTQVFKAIIHKMYNKLQKLFSTWLQTLGKPG
jgi:hypothetical protein